MTTSQQTRLDPLSADVADVTPAAAVFDRLCAAGGQLTERQLVTEVGYGTDACRRVLGELETRGLVTRRDVGPDTVVYASDRHPASSRR